MLWFSSVCKFLFLLTIPLVDMLAQDAGSFASLDIDFGTPTASVWGRYVVSDKTTVRTGWINPQDGEHNYTVTRLSANKTSHLRGIVYSPGCALQTFDIAIQELKRIIEDSEIMKYVSKRLCRWLLREI